MNEWWAVKTRQGVFLAMFPNKHRALVWATTGEVIEQIKWVQHE